MQLLLIIHHLWLLLAKRCDLSVTWETCLALRELGGMCPGSPPLYNLGVPRLCSVTAAVWTQAFHGLPCPRPCLCPLLCCPTTTQSKSLLGALQRLQPCHISIPSLARPFLFSLLYLVDSSPGGGSPYPEALAPTDMYQEVLVKMNIRFHQKKTAFSQFSPTHFLFTFLVSFVFGGP